MAEGQMLKTACGSPCYAPPEMILGNTVRFAVVMQAPHIMADTIQLSYDVCLAVVQYNGYLSDAWSMGVVLFAMLAGYLPFEDRNTKRLYNKILGSEYVLPKDLSPVCQRAGSRRRQFVTSTARHLSPRHCRLQKTCCCIC